MKHRLTAGLLAATGALLWAPSVRPCTPGQPWAAPVPRSRVRLSLRSLWRWSHRGPGRGLDKSADTPSREVTLPQTAALERLIVVSEPSPTRSSPTVTAKRSRSSPPVAGLNSRKLTIWQLNRPGGNNQPSREAGSSSEPAGSAPGQWLAEHEAKNPPTLGLGSPMRSTLVVPDDTDPLLLPSRRACGGSASAPPMVTSTRWYAFSGISTLVREGRSITGRTRSWPWGGSNGPALYVGRVRWLGRAAITVRGGSRRARRR